VEMAAATLQFRDSLFLRSTPPPAGSVHLPIFSSRVSPAWQQKLRRRVCRSARRTMVPAQASLYSAAASFEGLKGFDDK
jgi:hypothetical protein